MKMHELSRPAGPRSGKRTAPALASRRSESGIG
jgi:hypothetical protein